MKLFDTKFHEMDDDSRRVYALYELAHTLVDLGAALCFIVGSFFFFSDELQYAGTWLFVIGSFLFAVKPTLRFVRELKLLRLGRLGAADQPARDEKDTQ
ncbi:YrhK-like protein [Pacificibacter maritimus]|uniref:YrhK-like protein n=1 Tax=Pacificibacter maritimus TaxID=762213 RepID=A0A3N4UZX8_9RHOB|nr:YrhK family protein [Pacificibacter maritimus]RPE66224.1 YrhK-like protein [Pacificibacter maritimus]